MKSNDIKVEIETKSKRIEELAARLDSSAAELKTLKLAFSRNIAAGKGDKDKGKRRDLEDENEGLRAAVALLQSEVEAGEQEYSASLFEEARDREAAAVKAFDQAADAARVLIQNLYAEQLRPAFETVEKLSGVLSHARYAAGVAAGNVGITGRVAPSVKHNDIEARWLAAHHAATGADLRLERQSEADAEMRQRRAA